MPKKNLSLGVHKNPIPSKRINSPATIKAPHKGFPSNVKKNGGHPS